jgi:hypothetical protein
MTDLEPGTQGLGIVVDAVGFAGDIDTLWLYDQTDVLDQVTNVDDIIRLIDEIQAGAARVYAPDVAAQVDAIWSEVGQAVRSGELEPGQVRDFLLWVRYDQGLPGLSATDTAGKPLSAWIAQYAREHGWRPPRHPSTTPAPKPHGPAPAVKAVADAALSVRGRKVPAPGLNPTETAAISQAIGLAYDDLLGTMARSLDALLPGMAPGQVPGALADLFRATRVLEHQVVRAQAELAGKAPAHLGGQLHGAQQALHGLEQEVRLQAEQLAEVKPSTLHTHVSNNTHLIENLGKRVTRLGETVVPALSAGLVVADRNLTSLNHLTAGIHSGDLQHELNTLTQEVRARVEPSIQTLEDCCAENQATTRPIREGGATPSLLRKLGGILGKAFEVGFAATIVETLLAVIDMPVAVSGVVADTEALSGWAVSAAGAVTADMSWAGRLGA